MSSDTQLLEVPIAEGRLSLARTVPRARPRAAVLLVHGFAQNRFSWEVAGRSLPRYLAERGYDVYNLELRGHGRSRELGAPLPRAFEEHVDGDLSAALQRLATLGHERAFVLGHSLGGAIGYAGAGLWPERIRGLCTLAGVYRWGGAGPLIAALVRAVGSGARAGRALRLERAPEVRLDLLGRLLAYRLARTGGEAMPVPLQAWYPGSIEPEVLDAWLRRSLDRTSANVLAQMAQWAESGRFGDSRGRVDYAAAWRACRVPVLVLAADRDRLAHPHRDVEPAFVESSAGDRRYRCFGREHDGEAFGHVDLVLGRHAPSRVWPEIAAWLDERSQ